MRARTWHASTTRAREGGLVTFAATFVGARRIASAIAKRLRARVSLFESHQSRLHALAAAKPRHRVEILSGRLVAHTAMLDHAAASKVAQAFADVLKESTRLRVVGERRAPAKHRPARPRSKPARRAKRKAATSRKPMSRGSRRNPSERELRQADRMFREWHGFGPQHVTQHRVAAIPRALVKLGEIPRVYYQSDKWDKKRRTYVHHTTKPHPVLYTNPQGNRFFILGGRMQATDRGLIN